MTFERKAGWPRLLNEHVTQAKAEFRRRGFAWGRFDCATFACDWVLKMTGDDPLADYRGKYDSRESAIRALWGEGDKTYLDALSRVFGVPVHPAHAKRGDIAWIEDDRAVGVFVTEGAHQRAAFLGENGVVIMPMRYIDAGFVIG
ncbi:hypothetical protein PUV54_00065 [Hyphococcus flavus]|uniref:DUF6950 domain-containing protein n=1 Tax=Hyphococcus flavus TaxID=1866326 RepID=A0AAF0CFY4_9PROT|nr:hypothetical protein [Hyphococcus flavus]WDI31588.1 hypothetical protein PUV54_00065 [Hyphococcus flavus]